MAGVSLTSIITSCTGIAGFFLAFLTYSQWLTNKRKDDSYLFAKNYLTALNDIREILGEINFQYGRLCPVPGLAVEPEEIMKNRIENVNILKEKFSLANRNLIYARSELAFWKVKLVDAINKKHEALTKDLRDIYIVIDCLNHQLCIFYLSTSCNKDTQQITIHKKKFDEDFNSVMSILNERLSQNFEDFFIFE